MKRILAGLFTTMIMALMIWPGLNRSRSSTNPATDSETGSRFQDRDFENGAGLQGATDRIEGLLASARDGDAASYLGAFDGPLRARLEREADERGRDAFALLLRRAGLARKSYAIFAPEPDRDRTGGARITVESTFADRIERQTFRLEHTTDGWLVTAVETARQQVPQNAPGTLATYQEPEGNPMAAHPVQPAGDANQNQPEM